MIIGFISKFDKLKQKEEKIDVQIDQKYSIFYPKESQIISVNNNGDSQILLRYQLDGENKLILIDLIKKKIITKIDLKKSKAWKIE